MNKPKVHETDYIQFLIASPRVVSGTEAARVHPAGEGGERPAHDAFTRLLHRLEPDPDALWAESRRQIDRRRGVLVLDDSTLDKPYARHMDLVTRHWSGKHRRTVEGINLLTLLWTDGHRHIPVDYRIYDKARDGKTKNDHFRDMLEVAYQREFEPECVLFDSWYASLENLKAVRSFGWRWLTRLKSDRHVNPDGTGNQAVELCAIDAEGTRVHLKGYGFVRVFRIAPTNGSTDDVAHWATGDEEMPESTRATYARFSWAIEHYHRGLKQYCAVERAQVRSARAQRNHIGLSIRAFLRLERNRVATGMSWAEAKVSITRDAVRAYLANPRFTLGATA
jgi:putative transposase